MIHQSGEIFWEKTNLGKTAYLFSSDMYREFLYLITIESSELLNASS